MTSPALQTPARSRLKRLLLVALPALIIIGALVVAFILMGTRPTAHRAQSKPKAQARLVTVTPAEAAPAQVMISANGTVQSAQSTELRARVQGQVVALTDDLAPGTRFDKGDVLARIDPADYKLAVTQARSQLASARASLDTENGQQAVAKRELALVGSDVSAKERNLALRGPQLASARADVDSAQSQLDQAQLDLDRTQVTAPFAGMVTAREASVGDVVSTADTLATLAATDNYWVDVSMPVDQLRWLHAPSSNKLGSAARIYYPDAWGDKAYLKARVLRLQGQLEADGRLARVLLTVPHPLDGKVDGQADNPTRHDNTNSHQLLLGAYVEARLSANMPPASVMIDSAYLRENDTVWLMGANHTLDIRSVQVAYRDNTRAVIDQGLTPGDEVITSDLSAPIQGMPIRVAANTRTPDPAATQGKTDSADAADPSNGAARNVARNDRLQMAPATRLLNRQPQQQVAS